MNGTRAWKLIFFGGLVLLILASAIAFGPGWTLGIAGVVTLVIGLTQLIGPKGSFNKTLKRLLTVNAFLKPATITVWVVATSLAAYALFQTYRLLYPPPPQEPFRVTYF